MAKKRAGSTVKISISLDRDDVARLKRQAKREYGGNLSAALAEAARQLLKREAGYRLIEMLGGPSLTPEAARAIRAEQAGGPRYEPSKSRRKRVA